MDLGKWKSILCYRLILAYLELVRFTSRIQLEGDELLCGEHIIGFWHEDSSVMHLILDRVAGQSARMLVLITAEARGDVIERLVQRYGAEGFRVSYDEKGAGRLRQLFREVQERISVAVAWDGPTGPLHEPKKLPFLLAAQSHKSIVGIRMQYSHAVRVSWRWDHYVIPLPFSRITAVFHDLSFPTRAELKNMTALRGKVVQKLL